MWNKHCLMVGDSYLTTRHGLHVVDSFDEKLYYPMHTLNKLGFDKVTNMASGGSSMTEIYGRFEKYMHIWNPTHILIGLTNPLRVRHYKHFKTDDEVKKFQEINFEVIMRQNTILPKVMYDMAVDYNGILAHAVKAITELSAEVETLKTKVAALEAA